MKAYIVRQPRVLGEIRGRLCLYMVKPWRTPEGWSAGPDQPCYTLPEDLVDIEVGDEPLEVDFNFQINQRRRYDTAREFALKILETGMGEDKLTFKEIAKIAVSLTDSLERELAI